jgi:hypothetical protein
MSKIQERCGLVEFQPKVNAFACQPAAKKDCGPIASTRGIISTLPLDYENEPQRCMKKTTAAMRTCAGAYNGDFGVSGDVIA